MFSQETGYWYRQYPDAKRRNSRVYWVRTKSGGGAKYLHVDVWEKHYGPVPEGWHVHHLDHNPANNDITNLQAMDPSEHLSHHQENLSPERIQKRKEHIDSVRDLTKTWHASEEGRQWHREHVKNSLWTGRVYDHTCPNCGTEFQSETSKAIYCTNACKSDARRKTGVDNVEFPCNRCGTTVVKSKYIMGSTGRCRPCSRFRLS